MAGASNDRSPRENASLSKTILVVEDDQNDLLFLERALKRTNFNKPLQVVTHGDSAIEYLEGTGAYRDRELHPMPNLVLLDLKLPGKSGFEVLTWMRRQPRFKKLRITVLTGSSLTIDVYRAYEMGADSYLVKPVTTEKLAEMIQRLKLRWLRILACPPGSVLQEKP